MQNILNENEASSLTLTDKLLDTLRHSSIVISSTRLKKREIKIEKANGN